MKKIIFLTTTLAILIFFNYSIFENEQLLENGENIYLELRPVDPRSFMQGDYMRLRFKIEEDVSINNYSSMPLKGQIVITTNDQKIAQFKGFYEQKDLQPNEKLLNYRLTYTGIEIIPDSFLFQEGHAHYYQKAKYGIFKFHGSQKYLLSGLANKNLQEINVPKPQQPILLN